MDPIEVEEPPAGLMMTASAPSRTDWIDDEAVIGWIDGRQSSDRACQPAAAQPCLFCASAVAPQIWGSLA
jgi:hypothetical protein